MKKVVLFFSVAVAVALASCGNRQANPEPQVQEEDVLVIEPAEADTTEASIIVIESEEAPE